MLKPRISDFGRESGIDVFVVADTADSLYIVVEDTFDHAPWLALSMTCPLPHWIQDFMDFLTGVSNN